MEKRKYVKPVLSGEEFVPQVYCKNCSTDDNTMYTYSFECNAGDSNKKYAVWLETNNTQGLQRTGYNKDTERLDGDRRYYHPCKETHTVQVMGKLSDQTLNSIFPEGYIISGGTVTKVRVWTNNNTDTHCTTALGIDDFQLAKS